MIWPIHPQVLGGRFPGRGGLALSYWSACRFFVDMSREDTCLGPSGVGRHRTAGAGPLFPLWPGWCSLPELTRVLELQVDQLKLR